MTIRLFNTAVRKKVEFEPIDPENVRMYVCGPTVYDRAHLGNARPVIVFDTLFRLLRYTYGADHVTYVRNFTDVDDKINATALARQEAGAVGTLEELIAERSDETIGWYLEDMTSLGALKPSAAPRATGYIAQMIAMIEDLIGKGHGYAAEGHALFRVRSYEEYGALSGRSVDDMIAGARVEIAPFKEDPMDFVLWKPSTDDQPGWESPWGRGRPGWHIECSAMALDLLGEEFDIHGGGNDLQFPHHENEIAQSTCAGHGFAKVWMHNEMLQVEGKKMSKSLGNFFTVRDLLDKGVDGAVIRLVFLLTHYRKPMDWTDVKRAEAEKMLSDWFGILRKHGYSADTVQKLKASGDWVADVEFVGVLGNDLNTSGAISRMHVLAKAKTAAGLVPLAHALEMLGLVNDWSVLDAAVSGDALPDWVSAVIERLIEERSAARGAKDWSEADRVRDVLNAAGVQVTDVAGTASWEAGPDFDASVLEELK
ncbi:cysteine--tRNA ligase [Octadecabacter ascidiaceicola]|uniref:Cysteine--tRNA ligase n=1 Tax=Octadecabacter ascidiaceicola TaxID=1655543 RepID=A0A238JNG6_9RHOB|nr:cysteine--tRNA ligase [Octadecabacter ascidiaceicola]SMX31432.1 Cysteine--tRNA ligase [Octadecabacter ascidiaceicola]